VAIKVLEESVNRFAFDVSMNQGFDETLGRDAGEL
jgi:hypothetical protein